MFNIQGLHGTREGVKKQVLEAKETDEAGKPAKDQGQSERIKALVGAEIDALPKEFNGVNLSASGSINSTGVRQIEIRIFPSKLAI